MKRLLQNGLFRRPKRKYDKDKERRNMEYKKTGMERAKDYILQELSDPAYVEGYLNDLRKKWSGI